MVEPKLQDFVNKGKGLFNTIDSQRKVRASLQVHLCKFRSQIIIVGSYTGANRSQWMIICYEPLAIHTIVQVTNHLVEFFGTVIQL